MANESLRDIVSRLSASTTALAALAAAIRTKAFGTPLDPALAPHTDRVLRELGAKDVFDAASPEELIPLLTELRHFWLLDAEYFARPGARAGWTSTDGDVLASAGEVTQGFPDALARMIAPQLDGLAARLESKDAAFLDVGVGVGLLSMAVAKRFPALRVVGVDTYAPSLALARKNVAAAGLSDRIELREQAAEALPDDAAFDLAWIPAPFVTPAALPALVERVRRALKPGGWLLFVTMKPGEGFGGAVAAFRVARFGGGILSQDEVTDLLAKARLTDIRVLPGPPRDFKMLVAARRSP
jgi:SAM-dependent methyltransferase